MARKRFTTEQIITKLREAEGRLLKRQAAVAAGVNFRLPTISRHPSWVRRRLLAYPEDDWGATPAAHGDRRLDLLASRKAMAFLFGAVCLIFSMQDPGYTQSSVQEGKIYWTTSRYPPHVHRANLDGSSSEIVVAQDSTMTPISIALDMAGGKMYWRDNLWPGEGRIRRADLDGSNLQDIVTGINPGWIDFDNTRGERSPASWNPNPGEIALDLEGGKIYWTERASEDRDLNGIRSADLDGSNPEDFIMGIDPLDIALDATEGKIYWTEWYDRTANKIHRAGLDGSNIEELNIGILPRDLALDGVEGKIYWTEWGFGPGESPSHPVENRILRADLNGSNVEELFATGAGWYEDIALDTIKGMIYCVKVTYFRMAGPSYSSIVRARLDRFRDAIGFETIQVKIPSERQLRFFPADLALDVVEGKVYWPNPLRHGISRADLDGSNVEDLFPFPNAPEKIAVDLRGGKIYWTDRSRGNLNRADLDGSNVEALLTGLRQLRGITLDLAGGKIYWTDANGLWRSDLDGSDVEDVVSGFYGDLALDVEGGKIYGAGPSNIQRSNLDGTITVPFVKEAAQDIALDADAGKIYWSGGKSQGISRMGLNGGKIERSIISGPVGSFALDVDGGKIYWTRGMSIPLGGLIGTQFWDNWGFGSIGSMGSLHRSNLDGSNEEFLGYAGGLGVADLALAIPLLAPTFVSTLSTAHRLPTTTAMEPNFPNPFNASTQIPYRLAAAGPVRLEIHNILGQSVYTLVDQFQTAGRYQVNWNGRDQGGATVATGVYFARLHYPGGVKTRLLLLLQ